MAGSTPIYGFPYPQSSDLVANYPALGQELAEDVELKLSTAPAARSATAAVATTQTTTSSAFTDLATAGPAVTVTTGTKALVIVKGYVTQQDALNNMAFMSFAVSGATTLAASEANSVALLANANIPQMHASSGFLITGLTAGSNTFTAKYKRASAGTAAFADRRITVLDMGS